MTKIMPDETKASDICPTPAENDARYTPQLKEVAPSDPEYAYILQLMQQAFPEAERPDAIALRQRFGAAPRFHCCAVSVAAHAAPVGFITYWTFDGFVYVEHFAIDPAMRGRAYGSRTLKQLLRKLTPPHGQSPSVVLEVEMPDTQEARRRIAFYERAGWVLWPDTGYIQPAYRPGGARVPMRLMATAGLDPSLHQQVRDTLYRHVYRVDAL